MPYTKALPADQCFDTEKFVMATAGTPAVMQARMPGPRQFAGKPRPLRASGGPGLPGPSVFLRLRYACASAAFSAAALSVFSQAARPSRPVAVGRGAVMGFLRPSSMRAAGLEHLLLRPQWRSAARCRRCHADADGAAPRRVIGKLHLAAARKGLPVSRHPARGRRRPSGLP